MAKEIYCLFSVDNEYYQPNNNLVMWWSSNDLTEIRNDITAYFMKITGLHKYHSEVPDTIDDAVVAILQGAEQRIDNTDYRLDIVEERKAI